MPEKSTQFGASADKHHSDRADVAAGEPTSFPLSGGRAYSVALLNAEEAALASENAGHDFIIDFGDANDVYDGDPTAQGTNTEDREALNLVYLNEIWNGKSGVGLETGLSTFTGPKYDVIGNWTFASITDDNNANGPDAITKYFTALDGSRGPTVDSQAGGRYYSFDIGDSFHGIVLCDVETVVDGVFNLWDGNTTTFNQTEDTYINITQRNWLAADLLANRGKKIVIFAHFPINPSITEGATALYWYSAGMEAVITILQNENNSGGNIVAVMTGHHHPGSQAYYGSTDPLVFREGPLNSPFSLTPRVTDAFGIRYISIRSPICMGGIDPAGIDNATSPQSYVFVTIGSIAKGEPEIRLQGFGTNPGETNFNNKNYAIIGA